MRKIQRIQYKFFLKWWKNIEKIHLKRLSPKIVKYLDKTGPEGNSSFFLSLLNQTVLQNPEKLSDWYTDLELLTSSDSSQVYTTKFRDIAEIVKTVDKLEEAELLREFFVGMYLNRLSYTVPNYVTTLGLLKSRKNKNLQKKYPGFFDKFFLFTEKVDGILWKEMIKKVSGPKEFFKYFIEILFALECGQKTCGFTHFDLHRENIILEKIKTPYDYKICVNGMEYNIHCEDVIPKIIDFGHSTIKVDGMYYGGGDFPEYGMLNHIIPGHDMYKLLYSSLNDLDIHGKTEIIACIKQLFLEFYGKNDPYRLFKKNGLQLGNMDECMEEYGKMVSYSLAGLYTPSLLIDYLLEKDFGGVSEYFTPRLQTDPYPFQNTKNVASLFKEYTNVKNYKIPCEIGKEVPKSQIIHEYLQKVVEKVGQNNKINNRKSINRVIKQTKYKNFSLDIKYIQNINRSLPQLEKLYTECEWLLTKKITDKVSPKEFLKIKKLEEVYKSCEMYMKRLYTFRYLGYNPKFSATVEKKWVEMSQKTSQLLRWSESILFLKYTREYKSWKKVFQSYNLKQ
jgi:hypothetical protein